MNTRARIKTRPTRHDAGIVLLAAIAWCVMGCANPSAEPRVLRLHAASSLSDAFERLSETFEASHPGTDVQLSCAGSQVLRLQLEQGAPTDLFVSANLEHVQALSVSGHVRNKSAFAQNALALIVPPTNPAAITRLADLPKAQRLVIGTQQSPIGRYTRQLLHQYGAVSHSDFAVQALSRVVSQESNARLVRAKVALGEADAAIVYASDALGRDDVIAVPIPPAQNIKARYYSAVCQRALNADAAEQWQRFLSSEEAQAVLAGFGFEAP